ncbi:MAG: hypothetical protein KAS66_00070 [Candidatus Omnitrophica bacterium]|nr:hypothetical protein [Candidatus Omnitrophota bacterium]
MTTVADIRAGKTCPGCNSDCRNFVNEADTCIYNTFISTLYSETIEDQSNKIVQYEPVKERRVIVKIMPNNELTVKALNTNTGE